MGMNNRYAFRYIQAFDDVFRDFIDYTWAFMFFFCHFIYYLRLDWVNVLPDSNS